MSWKSRLAIPAAVAGLLPMLQLGGLVRYYAEAPQGGPDWGSRHALLSDFPGIVEPLRRLMERSAVRADEKGQGLLAP